mgnify:CR=1 FL=1
MRIERMRIAIVMKDRKDIGIMQIKLRRIKVILRIRMVVLVILQLKVGLEILGI